MKSRCGMTIFPAVSGGIQTTGLSAISVTRRIQTAGSATGSRSSGDRQPRRRSIQAALLINALLLCRDQARNRCCSLAAGRPREDTIADPTPPSPVPSPATPAPVSPACRYASHRRRSSASMMALITAGGLPTAPASPAPFTPSGLEAHGISSSSTSMSGNSLARGSA